MSEDNKALLARLVAEELAALEAAQMADGNVVTPDADTVSCSCSLHEGGVPLEQVAGHELFPSTFGGEPVEILQDEEEKEGRGDQYTLGITSEALPACVSGGAEKLPDLDDESRVPDEYDGGQKDWLPEEEPQQSEEE